MKRHVLPKEQGGDIEWFYRLNQFEQQETARQGRFKKDSWPSLEDGVWSKRPTYSYPHILPRGHVEKAFYPRTAKDVIQYLEHEDIAAHSEILNLRSSQAACLNLLFPLGLDLGKAARILPPLLPSVTEVSRLEFEYTGPTSATTWLGEPPGGKRGRYRTSIDAAVWWKDSRGKTRLTFVEFKYTEKELGRCGGYESEGNTHVDRCDNLDVGVLDPKHECYLQSGESNRVQRKYWEHFVEAGIHAQRAGLQVGCPFRGPFYQLMHQFLLAHYCQSHDIRADQVDVALLCFRGNKELLKVPKKLQHLGNDIVHAWNSLIVGVSPLRLVYVDELTVSLKSVDAEWAKYLNQRYGV